MKRNTSEQASPWKFAFNIKRFAPPKWNQPYLMYFNIILKALPLCFLHFGGTETVRDFTKEKLNITDTKGLFFETAYTDILFVTVILLAIADFLLTKNFIGPRLTGLHHGFKCEDGCKLRYHFYAERDFMTRYSAVDRDSFFSFLVFKSAITAFEAIRYNPIILLLWPSGRMVYWCTLSCLNFLLTYGNLYLYVQTRYNQEWSMSTFGGTWAYRFFITTIYEDGDKAPAGGSLSNKFYTRNARY